MIDPRISILDTGYLRNTPAGGKEGDVKKAAKEFESMFLFELLKTMRKSAGGSLFGKGLSADIYQTLFDLEIARTLAERGTGISDLVEKSLGKESATAVKDDLKPAGGDPPDDDKITPDRRLPVDGKITSGFGQRKDPITGEIRVHKGLDIAARRNTEIYPIAPGRVIYSGSLKGYGNIVIIRHKDGIVTRYAHNERNLVHTGEYVGGDRPIGLVGSSGRSTGPHLHFEVLRDGRNVDPAGYV